MAESDIYKAGYQHAIDDVCSMFDTMYARYQELWARDDQDMREVSNLELSLITMNSVICHLVDHKKFAVLEDREVC